MRLAGRPARAPKSHLENQTVDTQHEKTLIVHSGEEPHLQRILFAKSYSVYQEQM